MPCEGVEGVGGKEWGGLIPVMFSSSSKLVKDGGAMELELERERERECVCVRISLGGCLEYEKQMVLMVITRQWYSWSSPGNGTHGHHQAMVLMVITRQWYSRSSPGNGTHGHHQVMVLKSCISYNLLFFLGGHCV